MTEHIHIKTDQEEDELVKSMLNSGKRTPEEAYKKADQLLQDRKVMHE